MAANYVEANESLSKKDFTMRLKICRKEAKESFLWLRLIREESPFEKRATLDALLQETLELVKIFTAIIKKCGF